MEKQKAILAVYLVVIKDDKVLLYLRQNTGYCDGMYSMIAGHVNEGESATDAMIREAKEEAKIYITKDNLRPLFTMHRRSESERVDFFFELINFNGNFINNEPHKCKELKFFDLKNFPKNTISYVRKAIENSLDKISICEYGWE